MRALVVVGAAACVLLLAVSCCLVDRMRDLDFVSAWTALAQQSEADPFLQMGLQGNWQYDPEGVEERMEEMFSFLIGLFIICGVFVIVYLVCKYNNEKYR